MLLGPQQLNQQAASGTGGALMRFNIDKLWVVNSSKSSCVSSAILCNSDRVITADFVRPAANICTGSSSITMTNNAATHHAHIHTCPENLSKMRLFQRGKDKMLNNRIAQQRWVAFSYQFCQSCFATYSRYHGSGPYLHVWEQGSDALEIMTPSSNVL